MDIIQKKYMIYTIGYSCFTIDSFISLLKKHQITAIADVRSMPYSQFKPEFNREALINYLRKENLVYVFLGDHCGARIDAPECYVNRRADYKLISKHAKFQEGMARLNKGMQKYKIALLCAEKDPITCHRTILICRNLRSIDIQILHLWDDGTVEEHRAAEKRLMKLYGLDQPALYLTKAQSLEEAYNLQGEKIAYSENNENNEGIQNDKLDGLQSDQLDGVKANARY